MAMVDRGCSVLAAYTGRLKAQVGRFGPKVDSHLALLCIHCVNRMKSRNDSVMMTVNNNNSNN